jgi:hypothetical protein
MKRTALGMSRSLALEEAGAAENVTVTLDDETARWAEERPCDQGFAGRREKI